MRIGITLLFLAITVQLSAQQYDSTAWKYATTINKEALQKHLYVIASDEFEGRETGKRGQKMAMEYLIKEFKSYGIEDRKGLNYKQSFPLLEQESSGIELDINGNSFQLNREFTFSPSIIKNQTIEGNMIFVGYGINDEAYNDYEGIDVDGKAVVFLDKIPEDLELSQEWGTKSRVDLAKSLGAAAVFYYDESTEESLIKYEHYYNKPKMKLVDDLKEAAPVIKLTKKPTDRLLSEGKLKLKKIEKKGLKKYDHFEVPYSLKIDKPTTELTGENVIAFIEGSSKKEEVLVITAHYDHIGIDGEEVFNGADDDGTGTVSLLGIAEAFMQAVEEGNGPKRSVLIMPVSGEEKGLLGSKYYTNHPIFPLENTVANLNIDMIGRYDENHESDSNYIYLIGSDKLSTELHELSEKVNSTYTKIGLDYTFNDKKDPNRFYYRSDHYNFAKNNIPVIFYFSGVHEDYHKATDTVEKIDYEKTEKVARLVFMTAWEIANREERLSVDVEQED
jgi:hypothetical protein